MAPSDYALREALRQFRQAQADAERRKEVYYIFNNKALEDMVAKRPNSIKELTTCSGIGADKVRRYGVRLLAIIEAHTKKATSAAAAGAAVNATPAVEMPPTREAHANTPWTAEDVQKLRKYKKDGETVKSMAIMLGRSQLAVSMKLEGMGGSAHVKVETGGGVPVKLEPGVARKLNFT